MAKKKYVKGVVTNCNKLNIRSEPMMDSGDNILTVIDALTPVLVMPIDDNEEWYRVKVKNTRGYAMAKFIALEKGE